MPTDTTYQLHILIREPITIRVGALGPRHFPAGDYIYTGSAKRNLEARIARHLRKDKPRRWHIDYLTSHADVRVIEVARSSRAECEWHQSLRGHIVVPGFGASDCRAGCGAHLYRLESSQEPGGDETIQP